MNIQINCKDTVKEDDLRYIFHNLEDIKKEYEEDKRGVFHKKYVNGKLRWFKQLKGNCFMQPNIECIATERTLYFKIN